MKNKFLDEENKNLRNIEPVYGTKSWMNEKPMSSEQRIHKSMLTNIFSILSYISEIIQKYCENGKFI